MPRVAVNGAAGRMGRLLVARLLADGELSLGAALERADHPELGRDAGELAGAGTAGVLLEPLAGADFSGCELVVDFSLPAGLAALLERLGRLPPLPLVTGTTGLGPELEAALDAHARRAPVLAAPNFSAGIAVLRHLGRLAAASLPGWDLEVVEAHHRAKRDAPSGTALALARDLARARGLEPETALVHGRRGAVGPRPGDEIGVHALRGGGIVGRHELWLAGPHERLVLAHEAGGREAFADGALRALRWLAGRPPGRYRFEQVLGFEG